MLNISFGDFSKPLSEMIPVFLIDSQWKENSWNSCETKFSLAQEMVEMLRNKICFYFLSFI